MVKLVNRAKMTTSTTGTGTITLGSASDGYQTFAAAGVSNSDTVRYTIEDGNAWEIGTGTYTASGTTLSRTVSESSNSNNALNLSGNAVVFVTAIADDVGVRTYATISAMTSSTTGSAGSLAYVTANTSLYQNNGNGWYRIAVINTTPTISSPANNAAITLAKDGTPTTITVTATDADEGTTLTYSYTVSSGSTSGVATIKNASDTVLSAGTEYSTNVFKVVPAASGSGGNFSLTFNAHDQINTGQVVNSFTLAFGWGNVNDLANQSSELKSYHNLSGGFSGIRASVDFYDDGTKAVIFHGSNIFNCTCTSAYDISTASYSTSPSNQKFTGSGSSGYNRDFVWGDSGTAGYIFNTMQSGRVIRAVNDAYVFRYANDTALTGLGSGDEHNGIYVKDDASTKYLFVQISGTIKRYDWTTTFSNATNATNQTVTPSGFTKASGLRFNDVGTKIYMMDYSSSASSQVVRQFNLTGAWDLSTCSTTADYTFTIPSSLGVTHCKGVGTRPDGSRLYFANGSSSSSTQGRTHSFSFG